MISNIWAIGVLLHFFIFGILILLWEANKLRKWTTSYINGEEPRSEDETIFDLFKFRINNEPVSPWQFLIDVFFMWVFCFVASATWPISLPFLVFIVWIVRQRRLSLTAKKLGEDI